MHVFSKLRNKAFWTLDRLKGGGISRNLKDIENSLETLNFKELQNKNEKVINTLLKKAVEESSFYSNYKDFGSLQDFPVVNKGIIKDNFNAIYIKQSKKENLNEVSTSGSTGTPFKIYQCKNKQIRNTADTLYFSKDAGFTLGEKLLYLRLWSKYYRKSKIIASLQNIEQIDVEALDDKKMKELINKIENTKYSMGWLGYSSGFEKICRYLEKNNLNKVDCAINSIIAISEPITDIVKEKMGYYFNCPAVSRYSNVENGIIAQQTKNNNNFKINWASYIVEVLDMDSDRPVNKGDLGRIVVTDLYNLSTPMIRYDTGDVGAFGELDDTEFPVLETIHGRMADILKSTSGKVVSPFVIHTTLYDYPELEQFQIIQNDVKDYVLRINCVSTAFAKEDEFIKYYMKILGDDANLELEFVNEVPILKSGKRKVVVNNMG